MGIEEDNLVKVETAGKFSYYSLETPGGNRWTFEDEDLEESYIKDTLWAWSRLLDYVRLSKGNGDNPKQEAE